MLWMCWLALASAADVSGIVVPTTSPEATAAEAPTLADDPGARMAEAWRRLRSGDTAGALTLAEDAAREGAAPDEVTYLEGVAHQLKGDHTDAQQAFDDLVRASPKSIWVDDARLRAAISLAELGQPKEARKRLRRIPALAKRMPEDQSKVDLLHAAFLFEEGKLKPGTKKLGEALQAADGLDNLWYQARARATLWRWATDRADKLTLDGDQALAVQALQQRASLLNTAELQITRTVDTQEAEYVLQGLQQLGRSYRALAEDLRESTRPLQPDEATARAYETSLARKAVSQEIKAQRFYELGLTYAEQVVWQGPETDALRTALEDVTAQIETAAASLREAEQAAAEAAPEMEEDAATATAEPTP